MLKHKGGSMRKTLLLALAMAILVVTPVYAELLVDENDMKTLAERVMGKVAVEDIDAAFALMKPYFPFSGAEVDAAAIQTKALRAQYGERYGSPIGYEFIDSKKLGDSLIMFRYIEKTNRHALPWIFYFYKTPEGWSLNTFDWNDQLKRLFSAD